MKRYTLEENLISFGIGCIIAIPVAATAVVGQAKANEHTVEKIILYETKNECCSYQPESVKETDVIENDDPYWEDVQLSEQFQSFITEECEEHHISPELVIAMIEQESSCDESAVGDFGESAGLMQIKEKYHAERMDKLGCDDLYDPYENVTVGIDYLYELFQKYDDPYMVLMEYNGGQAYAEKMMNAGKVSDYVLEVLARTEELEGER